MTMPRDTRLDQSPDRRPGFTRRRLLQTGLALLGLAYAPSVSAAELTRTRQKPWQEIDPLDTPILFQSFPDRQPSNEARENELAERMRKALAVAPTIDPEFEQMSADLAGWFAGTPDRRPFREPAPDGWVVFKYPVAPPAEILPPRDRERAISVYTEVGTTANPELAKQLKIQFAINDALNPGRLQTYRDLFAGWQFSLIAQEQAAAKMPGSDLESLKPQVTGAEFVAPIWTEALNRANSLVAKVKTNPEFSGLEIA
jgi:hypothetical protein